MDLRRSLILVPTELERHRLLSIGGAAFESLRIELCGFGPVAAGITATQLLLTNRLSLGSQPGDGTCTEVLLCGIAGAYPDSRIVPGQVVRASKVMLDGVGVFEAGTLKSGRVLGLQPALPDQIELSDAADTPGFNKLATQFASDLPAVSMLTVCAASIDQQQARGRSLSYGALVEDMEGFAVAAACQKLNANLSILRGISNVAGDRDKSRWCIDSALGAVAKQVLAWLR